MKKRLVGAAILVSLFVIVTPMVLDPSRLEPAEKGASPIPPAPTQAFPGRLLRLDEVSPPLTPPPAPPEAGAPFEEPPEPLPPPDTLPDLPPPGKVSKPASPEAAPPAKVSKPASPEAVPPGKGARTVPPEAAAPGKGVGPEASEAVPPAETRVGLAAWAVQLSSFANAANAVALRDALRGRGFVAFVETAPDKTTRVYLGPELQKANAVSAQQRLARDLGIKGVVVPYPGAARSEAPAGESAGGPPRP